MTEALYRAIFEWLLADLELAARSNISAEQVDKLAARIIKAIEAK